MQDNLLKHGSLLFAATIAAAFLGYLYHLFMGRMLGPAEYGALASLFTFIYLFATPTGLSGAMQLTAAREISKLRARGNKKQLFEYARFFSVRVFLLALALMFFFLLFSPLIAWFLHVELLPVALLAVLLFFYLLLVVPWGLLQGLQSFFPYSASNLFFAIFKFGAAILLVFLGFGVGGAIAGIVVGIVFAALFCLFFLKDFFKARKFKPSGKKFSFFSWSVLLSLFFLMFLINIDIMLVKHFFSSTQAGHYSIASLLGKLVYFLAISFATVLLPMVSESTGKAKARQLLKNALLYTSCFAVALLAAFWFFSTQIVSIFFGAAFAPSAPLLPLFGVAMAFFSFSNILVYFEMGLNRSRHVALLAFFCIVEAIALWFFHSSLQQMLFVLSITNFLLLAALIANLFWKR